MGSSKILRRTPKAWEANIGSIMASGTVIMATCSKCQLTVKPVPLAPIAAKYGMDFSFWDRRPACRRPGCDARMLFMSSPGPNARFVAMLS